MSVKKMKCRIKGIVPLIMHNGRLKNPRDPMSKAIKEITSKKKKTDTDLDEISRLEWFAGLYTDEDNKVIIPGMNIEGVIINGAKKKRLGKDFQAGLFCDENPRVKYSGPEDPQELFADPKYVLETSVKVRSTGGSIMRTRPIFPEWSLDFTLAYADDVITKSDIVTALEDAGRLVGLCDWRPKFGRFQVVSCKDA